MLDADVLVPTGLFVAVAFIIVGVTKVISDGRTRRRLIAAGATPELARAITATPRGDPMVYSALKWGLVLGAVGVALIVVQFLPYGSDDPIVLGLILLFAGGGLLGYYAAARRLADRPSATMEG